MKGVGLAYIQYMYISNNHALLRFYIYIYIFLHLKNIQVKPEITMITECALINKQTASKKIMRNNFLIRRHDMIANETTIYSCTTKDSTM